MTLKRFWPALLAGCLLGGPLGPSLPASGQVKKKPVPGARHKLTPAFSKSKVRPAAAKPKQTGPAPVIHCDQPEHDFKSAAQGESVKHVFTLQNKGKGVLKIERARGG